MTSPFTRAAATIAQPLIAFALPPRCPICSTIVAEQHRFCEPCWSALDFCTPAYCATCGLPERVSAGRAGCVGCAGVPAPHGPVRAVVRYDGHSGTVPIALKYRGKLGLADLVARSLMRFADYVPKDALLVPVPLHRRRLWSRGFNQSALIAASLARLSGRAHIPDALERTRHTPPLRGMNDAEREDTVRAAFRVNPAAVARLQGRPVALIDDVFTTGATANGCAAALLDTGAGSVQTLCWARVMPGLSAQL